MHCLNCIITKEKLSKDSIKENNVYLTLDFEKIEEFPIDKYVVISTDYFGGCGEQSASFNNKEYESINKALSDFGIANTTNSFDLFEYCGLDKYRSNEDLEKSINLKTNE